jgi:hypothetical protein
LRPVRSMTPRVVMVFGTYALTSGMLLRCCLFRGGVLARSLVL